MKKEIIQWNNKFPLDKWWRIKYKIPYNSLQHQEISQVDIFFEYYEDILFKQFEEESKLNQDKEFKLSQGELLTNRSRTIEEEFDLFDSLNLSNFNIE